MKAPKCPIHKRSLVCPSCQAAAAGSLGGQVTSQAKAEASRKNVAKALEARMAKLAKKKKPVVKPKKKDPRKWGLEDTVAYLKNHPGDVLTAAEIVKALPREKRESAKIYVGQHLVKLEKRNEITRMGPGAYTYIAGVNDTDEGRAQNIPLTDTGAEATV